MFFAFAVPAAIATVWAIGGFVVRPRFRHAALLGIGTALFSLSGAVAEGGDRDFWITAAYQAGLAGVVVFIVPAALILLFGNPFKRR